MFERFWKLLGDHNGDNKDVSKQQVLIQSGGFGNLQNISAITDQIRKLNKVKPYFLQWKEQGIFQRLVTQ